MIDAFQVFEQAHHKAQFIDNSEERVESRYHNFLKGDEFFSEYIKQGDYQKAKLMAEVYCNELKRLTQSTPLDLIFNTLNKEKLK